MLTHTHQIVGVLYWCSRQGERCPKPTSDLSKHLCSVGTTRGVVGNKARTGLSGRGPNPRVSKARKATPGFKASYMQVCQRVCAFSGFSIKSKNISVSFFFFPSPISHGYIHIPCLNICTHVLIQACQDDRLCPVRGLLRHLGENRLQFSADRPCAEDWHAIGNALAGDRRIVTIILASNWDLTDPLNKARFPQGRM